MTFYHERGWCEFSWGPWYLFIHLWPIVWGFDYHFSAPCCKFWLWLGPFDLNRVWTEDELEEFV